MHVLSFKMPTVTTMLKLPMKLTTMMKLDTCQNLLIKVPLVLKML